MFAMYPPILYIEYDHWITLILKKTSGCTSKFYERYNFCNIFLSCFSLCTFHLILYCTSSQWKKTLILRYTVYIDVQTYFSPSFLSFGFPPLRLFLSHRNNHRTMKVLGLIQSTLKCNAQAVWGHLISIVHNEYHTDQEICEKITPFLGCGWVSMLR